MGLKNRYTSDGTIFYKEDGKAFGVQLAYNLGGGGAAFKTIKWATWKNPNCILQLQETNESPEMWGYTPIDNAGLLLYAPVDVISNVKEIQALVRLGYKGKFNTSEM